MRVNNNNKQKKLQYLYARSDKEVRFNVYIFYSFNSALVIFNKRGVLRRQSRDTNRNIKRWCTADMDSIV